MRIKRRARQGFIETSASSDMAFLLIIYFIVIAGFNVNTGFLMNLPAKDSRRLILKEELLRFEMDAAGGIAHNSAAVDIPAAAALIRAAQTANPNIAVLLTIDPQARWQRVVSFVELAQDLQVDAFSFSMRKDAP